MPLTSESRRPIPARTGQAPEKTVASPRAAGSNLARARPVDGGPANAGIVAGLRQSLAEKETSLQRASLAALQLQKQLDLAARQNETLRKQAQAATHVRALPVESWGAPVDASPKRRLQAPRLPQSALAELASDRSREIRVRLAAGALPAAVVAAIWGIWSLMPQGEFLKNAKPVSVAAGVPSRAVHAGPDVANGPGKGESAAGARFNQALSRLNNVLMYSPASAQQLLSAARQRGLSRRRNVCDFSWNGGQPALRYHEGPLIYTQLDDCASAVENYIYGQK